MLSETLDQQPSSILFWLQKANEIRQVADLCWNLDESVEQQLLEAELQGIAKELVATTLEIDADLKWVYGSLMAFAIQYICIGILIQRDPKRFLHEPPGYRIVELAEECGMTLSEVQKGYLIQVENAFKWSEKSPQWHVSLSHDQMRALKNKRHTQRLIELEEKQGLEELFSSLKKLALSKLPPQQQEALQTNTSDQGVIF